MIDRILSLFAWWGLSLGATASAQDMATMFAQYAQLCLLYTSDAADD